MPERFDVIVVGGGTAGCVLAARLSEEPERTVCLVEAGPDYGRYADGRWPSDMLDARTLPMSHLWENEPDDRSASRARILGGCSAHNACLVVWGSRDDYDEWGDGWTFAESSRTCAWPRPRSARGRIARTTCRRSIARCWRPCPRIVAAPTRGSQRPGRHRRHRSGACQRLGSSSLEHCVRVSRRRTVEANSTIAPETLVDRVEIAAGRALGVISNSGRLTADTVIVAAGAYASPALLQRSGIGPHKRN